MSETAKCGKPTKFSITPFMARACYLAPGHEGECEPGGNCIAHGPYLGETCPHTLEECIKDLFNREPATPSAPPSTPAAPPMNQCDGCRRGLPTRDDGYGGKTHYNPDGTWDAIGCTAFKYVAAAAPAAVPQGEPPASLEAAILKGYLRTQHLSNPQQIAKCIAQDVVDCGFQQPKASQGEPPATKCVHCGKEIFDVKARGVRAYCSYECYCDD